MRAIAFGIYRSSVRRGKEVFYTPIMKYAIRRYNSGRRFKDDVDFKELFGIKKEIFLEMLPILTAAYASLKNSALQRSVSTFGGALRIKRNSPLGQVGRNADTPSPPKLCRPLLQPVREFICQQCFVKPPSPVATCMSRKIHPRRCRQPQ